MFNLIASSPMSAKIRTEKEAFELIVTTNQINKLLDDHAFIRKNLNKFLILNISAL